MNFIQTVRNHKNTLKTTAIISVCLATGFIVGTKHGQKVAAAVASVDFNSHVDDALNLITP